MIPVPLPDMLESAREPAFWDLDVWRSLGLPRPDHVWDCDLTAGYVSGDHISAFSLHPSICTVSAPVYQQLVEGWTRAGQVVPVGFSVCFTAD